MKKTSSINLKSFALIAAVFMVSVMTLLPQDVFAAITFPAIPGVTGKDPVTVLIQLAAFIFKAIVYILFAATFAVGAYVAISTLLQIVKDRETAADLVGKLFAAVAVVVICYWFLSEGEKAADGLKAAIPGASIINYHEINELPKI